MYKILVVDDDPMILEENRLYFAAMGYEVVCADNAEAAEEIILFRFINLLLSYSSPCLRRTAN